MLSSDRHTPTHTCTPHTIAPLICFPLTAVETEAQRSGVASPGPHNKREAGTEPTLDALTDKSILGSGNDLQKDRGVPGMPPQKVTFLTGSASVWGLSWEWSWLCPLRTLDGPYGPRDTREPLTVICKIISKEVSLPSP